MLNESRPIETLIVDKGRWWGGAEASLVAMIRGFNPIHVHARVCVDYPMPHHERYRAAGAELVTRFERERTWMREAPKRHVKGLDFFDLTLSAARLHLLLRRKPVDVVHINLLRNRSQDVLAARLAGSRVIGHVRHLATQIPMGCRVLDCCDAVVCVSEAVRQAMLLTGTRTKTVTIYDGVDPHHFDASTDAPQARRRLNLPESGQLIACPAVLEPRKGQDIAIKALALLEPRDDLLLAIAGSEPAWSGGAYRQRLKRLAAEVGVESRVRFCGHLDDVGTLYAAADVVLALAQDGEAYGRVPVEAAHAERAVIATGLGATPEIVVDGETGLLVAPGDEGAVAVALQILLADRDLRGRMGREARARAARIFGFRQGLRALEDLYRDVVTWGPPSPA